MCPVPLGEQDKTWVSPPCLSADRHTFFMASLLSFLKSAIVLKSRANFLSSHISSIFLFYTLFLNTDWSEYHLSSHKYIQLVEKLRCILFLPNLFPSLARCSVSAPFGLTALTALRGVLLKNRRLVRKKNILFLSTNSTF